MFERVMTVSLLLFLGCNTGGQSSEVNDSNSNWLTACDDDGDCDPDDACVNARCHARCDEGSCAGTASECRAVSAGDGCVAAEESGGGYCFVPCEAERDCQRLGGSFRCEQGVCSTAPLECGLDPEPEPDAPGPEPEPAPSSPEPEPEAPDAGPMPPPECPAVASECPAECRALQGSPLHSEASCFLPPEVLGCFDPNRSATDDDNCLRRSDGAIFPGISGTYARGLVDSGEFAPCTLEEEERLSQALGTCGSPPVELTDAGPGSEPETLPVDSGPGPSVVPEPDPRDAGLPLFPLYSAQLTNGTGCCDFYTLVKADRLGDVCVWFEVRQEVAAEPLVTRAWALESAEDCWSRAREEGIAAESFDGALSLAFVGQQLTVTFDLTAAFSDPPAWLSRSADATFTDLPIDGEWHSFR